MRRIWNRNSLIGVAILSPMILIFIVIFAVAVSRVNPPGSLNFATFNTCREIGERIGTNLYRDFYYGQEDGVLSPPKGNVTPPAPTPSTGGGSSIDRSRTNVQVAGVDEADLVKYSDRYIFAVDGLRVTIFDASDLKKLASLSTYNKPHGIFLDESANKLVVIYAPQNTKYGTPSSSGSSSSSSGSVGQPVDLIYYPQNQTAIQVYNLQNISKPSLEKEFAVDGTYHSARFVNGIVYLVANYYPTSYWYVRNPINIYTTDDEIREFLPKIYSESDKEGKLISDCNNLAYYGDDGNAFTSVMSVDIAKSEVKASNTVLGGVSTIYMDQSSLIITTLDYPSYETSAPPCTVWDQFTTGCPQISVMPARNPENTTLLFKFSLDNGEVKYHASGSVEGQLTDQFAMDINSGFLRIALTSNKDNRVYVLDKDLKQVGSLTGVAPGERIYSMRYAGNRAYMVTYRQVDPFFVLDLSEPTNPKVLGELKLPGFSEYLHPYDENHVIGVGKDATDTGRVKGVKIAIFNVQNPAKPDLRAEAVLGEFAADSALNYDHKAFLMDIAKDLLVVPVTIYDRNYRTTKEGFTGFVVYSTKFGDGKMTEKGRLDFSKNELYYNSLTNPRSFYIGNNLYGLGNGLLRKYNLSDLAQTAEAEITDQIYYIY